MTTVMMSADDYGWGSREWIIKQAIPHAPEKNKDDTLASLVTFLIHGENYTARDVLDILTQGVLTGTYRPTVDLSALKYRSVPEPEVQTPSDDGLHPESDNPANPLTPFTEGEIRSFLTEMDEKLGDGIDPFTQKPTSWDFLDE